MSLLFYHQISACLLCSLLGNNNFKQKTDEKYFLSTILSSIHYCLYELSTRTTPTREKRDPSLLFLPEDLLSLKGKAKEEYLVKCVSGLSRLIETCLLSDSEDCQGFDVPLDELWSVIWRLMEGGEEEVRERREERKRAKKQV